MTPADREALVVSHLGHVRGVAAVVKRRWPRAVDLDDAIADGVVGLVQASQRYEPESGVPFWAFAARRVRGAIFDGFRQDHGRRRVGARPQVLQWPDDPLFDVPDERQDVARDGEVSLMARWLRSTVLPPRERIVVTGILDDRSYPSLARELRCSRANVGWIRQSAIECLRQQAGFVIAA